MTNKQLEHFLLKLTHQKGVESIPQLEVFLKDSKANVRKIALKSLGNLPFHAIQKHLHTMSLDTSVVVSKQAIEIIERNLTEPAAEMMLKAFIEKSRHPSLKEQVGQRLELRAHAPQIPNIREKIFQVGEFSQFINGVFPEEVKVEGELSAVQTSTHFANQWIFFDLKDEQSEAKLKCFSTLYKIRASRLTLIDGMRVVVTAKPRLSIKSGQFSLHVEKIELSGEGQLLKAFELLRSRLEQEGLFRPDRKRILPEYPSNIGLITSRDAAAFKDFVTVLSHRMGGLKLYFCHAQVQGVQAEESIVKAIQTLNTYPLDVVVLTRGGGAMDDLHAFNSEAVARAIYGSSIPVVSAIGHERDFTIADYVADVRAATPSNAAEIISKDRRHLMNMVERNQDVIESTIAEDLKDSYEKIQRHVSLLEGSFYQLHAQFRVIEDRVLLFSVHLMHRIKRYVDQIEHSKEYLGLHIQRQYEQTSQKIDHCSKYIQAMDYRENLRKGYGIIRKNGIIVTSVQNVVPGDTIDVEVADGKMTTNVLQTHETS